MKRKTVKIDISKLGSFSTIELARWTLNTRFYWLAQLNGCNYRVEIDIDGELFYLDYLYEESNEPLQISIEIDQDYQDYNPLIQKPNQKTDNHE